MREKLAYQKVLNDLCLLLPELYSGLKIGTTKTIKFFHREGNKPINLYLAPNLVRYHAIEELKNYQGFVVTDENDDDEREKLDLINVPNNGIFIKYKSYEIRILKTINGEVPIPGHSEKRKRFYCDNKQIPLEFNADGSYVKSENKVNLLILWEVDTFYMLSDLSIACPKEGGETKDSIDVYWNEKIPSLYLLGHNLEIYNEEVSDLPEEVRDLPITLK